MSHPVVRLFGSLANVVLDLGLPTIRGWLRDRLGPDADVADVSTDGSIVRLRGVRIPLGPRGLVILDDAAATITSLGDRGPPLRLHAFEGVLVFTKTELRDAFARTDDANAYIANATFRADVAFTAAEDPDPSAWIAGDLEIRRAMWTTGADVPANPLKGAARLFVSSREWRLEGGRLDGGPSTGADAKPPVVARFAAAGVLEQDDDADEPQLVIPRTLSTLAFTLEHGRIGPFLDALTALAGEEAIRARIPPAIPRDTQLDGELSWNVEAGARAELRLDAATIGARATVRAGCAPNGDALTGRVDGTVALAALLRRLDVPSLAMPRDEDVGAVVVTASGRLREPAIQVDVSAREVGFRIGRPRFVPAVTLTELAGQAFVKEGRLVGRVEARARGGPVSADIDGRDVSIRADRIDASFLRDLTRTLGIAITVPHDATATVALSLRSQSDVVAEGDKRAGGGTSSVIDEHRVATHAQSDGAPRSAWTGTVTLATGGSRLVAEVGVPGLLARITGGVKAEDVIAIDVFAAASVYPARGDVVVALDVGADLRARGSLAAAGTLTLAIGKRADALAYDVEGAKVDVTIDRSGVTYEALRFCGYEGRFAGYGAVPFAKLLAAPPYLVLQLENGGPALAAALLRLASPPPPVDVPPVLGARGNLVLAADLSLVIDLALTTPNGTNAVVGLRIAPGGSLHATTAHGTIALTDAFHVARVEKAPALGLVHVDGDVVQTDARTLRAYVTSDRVEVVEVGPLVLESVRGAVVVAANGDVLWNRAEARLAGGRLSSFGVARADGSVSARVSVASVGVEELPRIEGRALGAYVRGRASGTMLVRRGADGATHARGDVVLDEARFPVIDRVRPTLARYGLRPPNEDATAPAVATIRVDGDGIHVSDATVDLHGAAIRAQLDVTPARALDGTVEITLEEEYLRTSKVLTLPRVLGERLVIPVTIGGTSAAPEVKAEVGQTLGRFVRESKVGEMVASAVEEAQLFFRREGPAPPPSIERVPPAPQDTGETALRAAIEAHSADWEAIAARRAP